MDDWIDEGLGRYENSRGENEVFFKVVTWPSGNRLRELLELETTDFHITIGFKVKDIHEVDKSVKSLVK